MNVTDVERGLIARYAARVLSGTDLPVRAARQIVGWLYERHETMALDIPSEIIDVLSQQYTLEPLAKRRKADRLRVVGDRRRGALSLLVMT